MTEADAKKASEKINQMWAAFGIAYNSYVVKRNGIRDKFGQVYGIESEYVLQLPTK